MPWVPSIAAGGGTTVISGAGAVLLDEVELAADGTIQFDSIPTGYADLRIVGRVRTARANLTDDLEITVGNGTPDTGANYRYVNRYNRFGGATTIAQASGASKIVMPDMMVGNTADAGQHAALLVDLPGYADGAYRQVHAVASQFGASGTTASAREGMVGGTWLNNTDPINVIVLAGQSGGDLKAGSAARLYGFGPDTVGVDWSDGGDPTTSHADWSDGGTPSTVHTDYSTGGSP